MGGGSAVWRPGRPVMEESTDRRLDGLRRSGVDLAAARRGHNTNEISKRCGRADATVATPLKTGGSDRRHGRCRHRALRRSMDEREEISRPLEGPRDVHDDRRADRTGPHRRCLERSHASVAGGTTGRRVRRRRDRRRRAARPRAVAGRLGRLRRAPSALLAVLLVLPADAERPLVETMSTTQPSAPEHSGPYAMCALTQRRSPGRYVRSPSTMNSPD
jgi:hypothetical protein